MGRLSNRSGCHARKAVFSYLMGQIADLIAANGSKQVEVAERCGIMQPRMNDLLRGRVSRFSLDALVNIATALGRRVHMELETS